MTEETTRSKDGDLIKHKTVRLPVKTYGIRLDFQVKDAEAAKEAWRQLVKASGCSIITGPVLREDLNIWHDHIFTVIKGSVVECSDIPGPWVLRNPNYLDVYILEDSDDLYT